MSRALRANVACLYKSACHSRVNKVDISGKSLLTPCYFPAISSYATKYPLSSLISFLHQYSKTLLVSAYDLYEESDNKNHLEDQMEGMSENIIMLDSGKFESSWFNREGWSIARYKEIVESTTHDLYTSYDLFPTEAGDDFEKQSIENINQSIRMSERNACVPIVHVKSIDSVLSILKETTGEGVEFVALPERELGDSIYDRCYNISKIRQFLDSTGLNILIHILGAGHPISVLLYVYGGADSFDSLDWQKHVIDPQDLNFKDYAHLPLIECDCKYCNNETMPYVHKAYLHNLFLMKRILNEVIISIRNDNFKGFLSKYTSPPSLDE